MIEGNGVLLKERFPKVFDALQHLKGARQVPSLQVSTAKDGSPTLAVEVGGRYIQITSKYNPVEEAAAFCKQFEDQMATKNHILFYGIGFGYQVEALMSRYTSHQCTIIEPFPEMFQTFLSHRSLEGFPLQQITNICLEYIEEDLLLYLIKLVETYGDEMVLVIHPAYERLFPELNTRFIETYKKAFATRLESIQVHTSLEKIWVVNSLLNVPDIVQSPNILLDLKQVFYNKPVIIAAAGPSLEEEIPHLKYIKEKKLAYIFSVGTSINGMLAHGLYPDAACTYDPSSENEVVFQSLLKHAGHNIPLLFGSSVSYNVVKNYTGPKVHMITDRDSVSPNVLKTDQLQSFERIHDATSISIIALQLLQKLGANPIILAGQNLAFGPSNEAYSKTSLVIANKAEKDIITVEGVTGEPVRSNKLWDQMRFQIEVMVKQKPEIKVINTTVGGAKIAGTAWKSLVSLIEDTLLNPVVEENWYTTKNQYDLSSVKEKVASLKLAAEALIGEISEVVQILRKIDSTVPTRNVAKISALFPKLDRAMATLSRNEFLKTVVLPMNQVKYNFFMKKIAGIREEKNVIKKATVILREFGGFILPLKENTESLQVIMNEVYERTMEVK